MLQEHKNLPDAITGSHEKHITKLNVNKKIFPNIFSSWLHKT